MTANEEFLHELNNYIMRQATPDVSDIKHRRMQKNSNDLINLQEDDDYDNGWNCGSWFEYLLVVILSTLLLVGVLMVATFWIMYYRGGFTSNSPNNDLEFNLHPVLMIAGFVTLSGFSILLYRLSRCVNHFCVKLVHMFFHGCAIPCIALGFLAVFNSHNSSEPPKPNFVSLHSWLGLVTMGMFALQFVVGFFSFLVLTCCAKHTYTCRSAMVPLHASFGLVNFLLAITTCVSGLIEKEHQLNRENVENGGISTTEHYIINTLGIMLVALGIVVSVAVRRSNGPNSSQVYVTEC